MLLRCQEQCLCLNVSYHWPWSTALQRVDSERSFPLTCSKPSQSGSQMNETHLFLTSVWCQPFSRKSFGHPCKENLVGSCTSNFACTLGLQFENGQISHQKLLLKGRCMANKRTKQIAGSFGWDINTETKRQPPFAFSSMELYPGSWPSWESHFQAYISVSHCADSNTLIF